VKQVARLLFLLGVGVGFTLGMLWLIDRRDPVKVAEGHEKAGLDSSLHGEQPTRSGPRDPARRLRAALPSA